MTFDASRLQMERATGFEPVTASLEGWDSTTELRPHPETTVGVIPSRQSLALRVEQALTQTPIQTQQRRFSGRLEQSQGLPVEQARVGGQARIRTLEADGNRFTVCPLCPLGYLPLVIHYSSKSKFKSIPEV